MKKFFAVLLALAMVFAMSSVAMAATVAGDATFGNTSGVGITNWATAPDTNESTGAVSVGITNTNEIATIYNVTIEWTDLEFSYKVNGTSTWNPANHTYITEGEQGWDKSEIANAITVWNHSNADVTVTPTYDVMDNGITVELKDKADSAVTVDDALVLKAADEVAYGIAEPETNTSYSNSQVFSVTVSGTPSDISADTVIAGTLKLTIDAVTP